MDFARTQGIALAQFVDGALLFGVKAGNVDARELVPPSSRGLGLLRVESTDRGSHCASGRAGSAAPPIAALDLRVLGAVAARVGDDSVGAGTALASTRV